MVTAMPSLRPLVRCATALWGATLVCGGSAAAQALDVGALADIAPARGVVLQGEGGLSAGQPIAGELGHSMAFVDANGDGFDDVLIGAPGLARDPLLGVDDEAGHAYLFFGGPGVGLPGSDPTLSFTSIPLGAGIDFVGAPGDRVGSAVAAAGDVNDDGFDDFIIGASNRTEASRPAAGGAYVVFGSDDLDTLFSTQVLATLAASGQDRAVYLRGARTGGQAGTSVSGGIDSNADGLPDVVLGAPFDSTDGFSQNGTATVVYGSESWPGQTVVDLLGLGTGAKTEVRGVESLQFLGAAVAGVGRFDSVLPMTNGQTAALGDEVAIGAPGTSLGGLFGGAVYVLRGDTTTPALTYLASDFGNGDQTAGLVYTGAAAGDEAGASVAGAGDVIPNDGGFTELYIGAPFNDALGKVDRGALYVISGGSTPQGFNLGTTGTSGAHVAILGQGPQNGAGGVHAATGGDWDGDGLDDVALGFPHASYLDENLVALPFSGRVRVISGSVLQSGGSVNLDFPVAGLNLIEFGGETADARAGTGIATGDFDGDGIVDVGVGAPGAPSELSPVDPSGIAFTRTGRGHVLLGPAFRVGGTTPGESWFRGPSVTVDALNLIEPFELRVDGQLVNVLDFAVGNNGSIEFEVPQPLTFGATVDVSVATPFGLDTFVDGFRFVPLEITDGPTPDRGLPGHEVEFMGLAFSDIADTQVDIGGFPAEIMSLDNVTGSMTVVLPKGPPLDLPVDVAIQSSNGTQLLAESMIYRTIMIESLDPASGSSESGIIDPDLAPEFPGVPTVMVDITLDASIVPPQDLEVEMSEDGVSWTTLNITGQDELVATVAMPFMLEGPADRVFDFRVSDTTGTDILEDAYTYLGSDFRELPEYAQAGFGSAAPRLLMAGEFTGSGDIVLIVRNVPDETDMVLLFVGLGLADPPLMVQGGPFGIDPSEPFFLFFLPPPDDNELSLSATVTNLIDPAADGLPVYVQVITAESMGDDPVEFIKGFSNVIEAILDVEP